MNKSNDTFTSRFISADDRLERLIQSFNASFNKKLEPNSHYIFTVNSTVAVPRLRNRKYFVCLHWIYCTCVMSRYNFVIHMCKSCLGLVTDKNNIHFILNDFLAWPYYAFQIAYYAFEQYKFYD